MKAAQIKEYGGKDAIQVTEVEKTKAGEGHVLVEVYAASVNPFDWKVRDGIYHEYMPVTFPYTPGGDASGVVAEVGDGVKDFEIGQEVYGQASALSRGSIAEFTSVKATQLAIKPKSIDFIESAALPLVSSSAYQALYEHLNLQSGQKILIHGGAGGIGAVAIQMAKHIGAYVATTVSENDIDYVKVLGADEVIDYKTEDFSEKLKNFDAVFDTVGGETTAKSYKVIKSGGSLVSMVSLPDKELVQKYNVKFTNQATKTTSDILNKIAELVDSGVLKVNIDKVFPLDLAAEAMEYLKTGHPRGKVVIKV